MRSNVTSPGVTSLCRDYPKSPGAPRMVQQRKVVIILIPREDHVCVRLEREPLLGFITQNSWWEALISPNVTVETRYQRTCSCIVSSRSLIYSQSLLHLIPSSCSEKLDLVAQSLIYRSSCIKSGRVEGRAGTG